MKRWVDVDPSLWFYRAVLESERIKATHDAQGGIINSGTYNAFKPDYPRKVYTFVSTENQVEFKCPGYKMHKDNLVSVYIDGVFTTPASTENEKIFIANPISSGIKVTVIVSGIPQTVERGDGKCSVVNTLGCSAFRHPSADLEEKDNYVYNSGYALNEYVFAMGRSLRRINVEKVGNESDGEAVYRVMGLLKDCFTIMNGVVYVSMEYNDVPVLVNYNYTDENGVVKNRQGEEVIPTSACPVYNDRFMPYSTLLRYEFYTILSRLRENLYRRFTDGNFSNTKVQMLNRDITDIGDILGNWYDEPVLNILEEKFLDGCYVMPLYDDDTFKPNECVTRAEMVVALSRFMEWALEKFK